MGVAFFHLMPESSVAFQTYFTTYDPNSKWKNLPVGFFIAFISYALILLVEKVAFDSHSLTHHEPGGHHGKNGALKEGDTGHDHGAHEGDNDQDGIHIVEHKGSDPLVAIKEPLSEQVSLSKPLLPVIRRHYSFKEIVEKIDEDLEKDEENDHLIPVEDKTNEESDEDDEEEETLKNVVSSHGKFASFLQARNLMNSSKDVTAFRADRSLWKASKILSRATKRTKSQDDFVTALRLPFRKSTERKVPTQIQRKHSKEEHPEEHHHIHTQSSFTPYLLLIALSIHGLFEGIALGIQDTVKESIFFALVIIAHKWAESYTLGISFHKSQTERQAFIRMVLLFAVVTPIGVILGMTLVNVDPVVSGLFLGVSSGTFIYVSASEVIVEEFAITKHRYQKFFLFLFGGMLVAFLSYLELLSADEDAIVN
jgi:zinc transporter ZupT